MFFDMELKSLINNLNIDTKNKELLVESFLVFGLKVVGLLAMFAISILLARGLGAEGIGDFYLAQSIVNIALVVAMLGLGNHIIKMSAHAYCHKDWGQLESLKKNAIRLVAVISALVTVIIIFLATELGESLFNKHQIDTILKWLCLTLLPMNVLTVYVSLYKGIQRTAVATFFENVGIPVIVLFLILLNVSSLTLIEVVKFYVLASCTVLLLAALRWGRLTSNHHPMSNRLYSKKEMIRSSLPLYGVALTNLIISVTDTIMLGFWETSEVIGQYGVALRIASISSIVLIVTNTVVASKFAVYHKVEDMDGLSRLAKGTTGVMAIIAFLFLIFLLFFNDLVLSLFGADFLSANRMLVVLAIGQFFVLSTGPVAILLMMTGHEKFHQYTTVISAVLNIVLNAVLIPMYGGLGAAVATAVSLALKNIIAVSYVNLYLNIRTLPGIKRLPV